MQYHFQESLSQYIKLVCTNQLYSYISEKGWRQKKSQSLEYILYLYLSYDWENKQFI